MSGDDKVRFCGLCKLNVYNISALTGRAVEQLIARTEGRLCAELSRRPANAVARRLGATWRGAYHVGDNFILKVTGVSKL